MEGRIGSQRDQPERYFSDSSENWKEFEELKGGKKTQSRGERWNQLVLETECVRERERKSQQ